MNGNEERLAALGKELGFAEWAQPAPDERLFVWRFFLGGGELPGWRLHRSYRTPGNGLPPGLQSVWTRDDGTLLRVDVFEASSSAAAREGLLAVAGEHQAAGALARAGEVGEVALAGPGESLLALVRGNLVLWVRGGSGPRDSVRPHAARLDALVAGTGPEGAEAVRATVRSTSLRPDQLDALSGRVLAAGQDEPPRTWFRFRSTGGEVVLERGRPVFRPSQAGAAPAEITVDVVQPTSAAGPDLSEFGIEL